MKNLTAGLALSTLAFFAGNGHALTNSEDFDYAPGTSLSGQAGGVGLLGPWAAASTFSVTAGSLSYPGLTSSGNRAVFTTDNFASFSATRRLAMGADGSTLWLSFLMRMDGNPSGLVSDLIFAPTSGNNLRIGKVGAADTRWGVVRDGGAEVLSATPIVAGMAALFVVRFDFNADANADDKVSIYIDPQPGAAPGAPVVTYANNNFGSLYTSFQWAGGVADFSAMPGAGSSSLDGIRGGDNYAAVAPLAAVPEPSALALMAAGLGLLGAAMARRSRTSLRR